MGRPQFSRRSETPEYRAAATGNYRYKDYSFTTASGGTDNVDLVTKSDEPDAIKFANEVVTGVYVSEVNVDPQKVRFRIYCQDKDNNTLWTTYHTAESLNFDPAFQLPPDSSVTCEVDNFAGSSMDMKFSMVIAEPDP